MKTHKITNNCLEYLSAFLVITISFRISEYVDNTFLSSIIRSLGIVGFFYWSTPPALYLLESCEDSVKSFFIALFVTFPWFWVFWDTLFYVRSFFVEIIR